MRACLFALLIFPLSAAVIVEELRIVADSRDARVRPGESIVLQVRGYGRVEQEGEETRSGRLEVSGWKINAKQDDGGWLSKPFRFQGTDTEKVVREKKTGFLALFNGDGPVTNQDSVLYTAPDRQGKYTIEVSGTYGGKLLRGQLEIEVNSRAESRFTQPRARFEAEPRDTHPYRVLAEHYAPFIAQETWFQPRADYLHRFDFDGDWQGDNNWDQLESGSPQAYVYYAAMETETHWFLHYNFFHPRDYSDTCIAGTCHENDNEGVIVTVRKNGTQFGQIEVMETLAHNNVYSYTNRKELAKKLHNIDGPLVLFEESHPIVFLEAGGHGALGAGDRKSYFDAANLKWKQNTGVTYKYKGRAEVPKGGGVDEQVGYDLLPILDQWWKRHQQVEASQSRTFADFYEYKPYGNRPRPANPVIAGAFLGTKHSANKARPFWGWFDAKGRSKKVLAPGQWALDPAYSLYQSLRFPKKEPWSMDYIYNPYLGFE